MNRISLVSLISYFCSILITTARKHAQGMGSPGYSDKVKLTSISVTTSTGLLSSRVAL
jgi:hypothetical protein